MFRDDECLHSLNEEKNKYKALKDYCQKHMPKQYPKQLKKRTAWNLWLHG